MRNYTFVINTYPSPKRPEELIKTLEAVLNQTYKNFNILLVENYASQDSLRDLLVEHNMPMDIIQLVNDPVKRLSFLFNLGWKNANSDYLVYVADDVVLEPNWLENADREFDLDPSIGIVTGPIISVCYPAGEMHRLYLASQNNALFKVLLWPYMHFAFCDEIFAPGKLFGSGAYSFGASLESAKKLPRQEIDLATTSSMCIKKEVLLKINGFDERFNFNHADGDLFIRTRESGYKIIFNPNVVSHHHMRLGLSRNSYFIGKDTGMFYKKDIRPKNLSSWIGAFLNVTVLNVYWIYATVKTRNLKNLRGISGFVSGLLFS